MAILDPRLEGVAVAGSVYADHHVGSAFSDTFVEGAGDDRVDGGAGNDSLFGGAGNDILIGGTGADFMSGGTGNDWFFVDDPNDSVADSAGQGTADRVFASVSYSLTARAEVETISTIDNAGTAPINLTGNEFAQAIYGNAGDNMLRGGGGGDGLVGFAGNDWYFVDDARDSATEAAGEGNDRVFASVSWNMTPGSEIEMLSTADNSGTQSINLRGNEFAQTIAGNAGSNIISGGLGNDTLMGFGGNDFFLFEQAPGPGNVDQIADFTVGQDHILLIQAAFTSLAAGTLSGSNFMVRGTALQDANDFIIYDQSAGALFYDPDGSGPGAATPFANVTPNLTLHASDILVA
jgi:Ca2+-binding RTX toxin-like protein